MATQHTYTEQADPAGQALTDTTLRSRVGILERWRAGRAERERRVIVHWLRRTASRAHDGDPIRRHRETLLHYRASAVHTDLLEIAALLERTHDPDPACIGALHALLADDDGNSPLYNTNIPFRELEATLDYVRSSL